MSLSHRFNDDCLTCQSQVTLVYFLDTYLVLDFKGLLHPTFSVRICGSEIICPMYDFFFT